VLRPHLSSVEMPNPWLRLPERAPHILPEDEAAVTTFNSRLRADDDRRFDLELMPEPFIGCRRAPVVILMHNPGKAPSD